MLAGLGLAVAHVSRAASYMGDSPETCVNCHVMVPQYATWQRSSHARVTSCNDCHVPHDNFAHHYSFKARDGMYHSYVFTMRLEPQVIRISSEAKDVVEENCRRCHSNQVDNIHARRRESDSDTRCWDCHRDVPHGMTRSQSAVPRTMAPHLPGVLDSAQDPTIGGRAVRPQAPKP